MLVALVTNITYAKDCHENCLCPYSHHQFHHLILVSIKTNTLHIKFVTNGKGPRQKVRIFNTFFFPPLLIKHFMGRDAICRHPISESLCHKNCLELWNRKNMTWEIYLQDAGRLHFQLRCIQMLQKGIYCLQTAAEMETGPSPSPSYALHALRRFCTTRPSYLWSNMEMQNLDKSRHHILYWLAQFGQALNFSPASG